MKADSPRTDRAVSAGKAADAARLEALRALRTPAPLANPRRLRLVATEQAPR